MSIALPQRNWRALRAVASSRKTVDMFIGTKVTLGGFVPEDYTAMYCWANDILAARFDGAFRPVNLTDVVRQCETAGKDPLRVMLAIRRRTDPRIIGYVHIQNISAVHRSADIGMRIGEEQNRGQGLGTEALSLALDYCWRHLNLQRVALIVFRNNARAVKAYKSAGFTREGLLKKLFFVDGAWVDVMIMAAFRPTRERAQLEPASRNDSAPLVSSELAAAPRSRAA